MYIESVIKNLPIKKSPDQMASLVNFMSENFKGKIRLILLFFFPKRKVKTEEEGTFPDSLY